MGSYFKSKMKNELQAAPEVFTAVSGTASEADLTALTAEVAEHAALIATVQNMVTNTVTQGANDDTTGS